jgi:hypothetical protein
MSNTVEEFVSGAHDLGAFDGGQHLPNLLRKAIDHSAGGLPNDVSNISSRSQRCFFLDGTGGFARAAPMFAANGK